MDCSISFMDIRVLHLQIKSHDLSLNHKISYQGRCMRFHVEGCFILLFLICSLEDANWILLIKSVYHAHYASGLYNQIYFISHTSSINVQLKFINLNSLLINAFSRAKKQHDDKNTITA